MRAAFLLVPFVAILAAAGAATARTMTDAAVEIRLFTYRPGTLEVSAGTRVVWSNGDETEHTATSDGGEFDGKLAGKGSTFAHTFTRPGRYAYACGRHPSMRGTIHVQPTSR